MPFNSRWARPDTEGPVALSAGASIQRRHGKAGNGPKVSWVQDTRPALSLYLMLAVDDRRFVPEWLVDYMQATGILDDAEMWRPTDRALERFKLMPRHALVSTYRRGAVAFRLLCTMQAEVEPTSGRLYARSASLLWERIDMLSSLSAEVQRRVDRLVMEWEDDSE